MADQHELKRLYEGIDTDDAEMARYRHRLASRFQEKARARPNRRWLWISAPLLAGLAAWAFVVVLRPDLNQWSLQELETLVADSTDLEGLRNKADSLLLADEDLVRLNAHMVLCLAYPDGGALEAAARGALLDPRPEFRAFYLEYLLDHADSYQLDIEKIEIAMDKEVDRYCLDLYSRLLRVARHAPGLTA